MGLFSKKDKNKMITYTENAGGCIVTKSLLEGNSHLRWIFREKPVNQVDNGWRAFGAEDTQEYIDNSENLVICDFNTLVNIEPAIMNIYEMPIGSDLEFVSDNTGRYFIDTQTGKEIREKVTSPIRKAFKKNMKFISNTSFDVKTVDSLFEENEKIKCFKLGECEFKTGEVIAADPLCYLQDSTYVYTLEKSIPAGSYPVLLSVLFSEMAGIRIAGAKLKVTDKKAVRYEPAQPREEKEEKHFPPMAGFAVEAGMGCFCDKAAAVDYWTFLAKWYKENKDKNIYDDYFKQLFAESYETEPEYQREEGDFLLWNNPVTGSQIAMFASGLGDGYYPVIWGMDSEGNICELVEIFMNPELF